MAPSMQHGVNIAYWLSQSRMTTAEAMHRPTFFNLTDVDRIAAWGMDHVRLPVDQQVLWDATGGRIERRWDMLDVAVGALISKGLTVMLDLHTLTSHDVLAAPAEATLFEDPQAQESFADCWAQLSDFFRARPVESLVYELLNEPMAPDAADWNRVYRPVFDKLRAAEPERWLKLGCNWYQTPETMGQLAVPEDPRTILGFHFYAPHCLTHFQAAWSQGTPGYAGPVQYPGQIIPADQAEALDAQARADLAGRGALENWDADRLATQLAEPLAVRDRTGLALHCGELGCLATVPAASRLRWYTDVLDMLDARDIGWCIWNYKSTAKFGLVDDSGQPTDLGCMIRQRLATRD